MSHGGSSMPGGLGTRTIIALSLLGTIAAIRFVRDAFVPETFALPEVAVDAAGSAMAAGFLFLFAFVLGGIAEAVRLPRITGYLVGGMLVGPEVLGTISAGNIADLSVVNGFAIGVIAFVAGAELRPQLLRERGRIIMRILVCEIGVVFVLLAAVALLLRAWVPFLAGLPFAAAVAMAFVFASIATVHSPAVTIALLDEVRSRGPVTSTTLGVVVVADVVVVLLATLSITGAQSVLSPDTGFDLRALGGIAWELIGALVAGALLGLLIDLYLRRVGTRLIIFVIFIIFFGYELAQVLHVEHMLFMLAAGFFVENISPVDGEPLIEAVQAASVPAYVLFFSVAGGSIHLRELAVLWPVAVGAVVLRAFGLWLGTRIGADWAQAEPQVKRYTWMGLVSQAGVALGLATVATRALGEYGGQIQTMFLAMIAIHEIIGPILFRTALSRSGELPDGEGAAAQPRPATA